MDFTWTTTEVDHRLPSRFQVRMLQILLFGGCVVAVSWAVRSIVLVGTSDMAMTATDVTVLLCGVWILFANVANSYRVAVGSQRADSHLDDPVLLPVLLIYGWHIAFMLSLTKHIISQVIYRKRWYKTTYNIAVSGSAMGVAELMARAISPSMTIEISPSSYVIAALVAAMLLTTLTHALTSIAIYASTPGASWSTVVHDNRVAHINVIEMLLAAVTTIAWRVHPTAALPAFAVSVLVLRSWRLHTQRDASREGFLDRLVEEAEYRDPYSQGHSKRVGEIAAALAVELNVNQNVLRDVCQAGRWHDVGKLSLPDALLLKTGRLRDSEVELAREHVNIGDDLLSRLDVPHTVAQAIAEHHERIDGSGYPKGGRLQRVSVAGQIVGLAEVFDAQTMEQPFRPARRPEVVVRELYQLAREGIYDVSYIRALVEVAKRLEKLPRTFRLDPEASPRDASEQKDASLPIVDLNAWKERTKSDDEGE